MRRDPASWLIGVALVVLAATPLYALRAGRAWEAGNLAGLAAALLCVLLTAWPVRPRAQPAAPAVRLKLHRDLGLAAFALALAHVAILIWREPLLIEHLWPTAPLYMACGLVGLVALGYVALAGLWPVRRHFRSPARFQFWHIVAALVVLVTVAAHAVGAARYLDSHTAVGIAVLASVLATLVVLRARRHGRRTHHRQRSTVGRLADDSVCPRYGLRLTAIATGAALLTVLLLAPSGTGALHRTWLQRGPGIALSFPHEKHREVNCVLCHHNYVDHTGSSTCVVCHRTPSPALKVAVEPRFHDFCEGCHMVRTDAQGKRGPIRSCASCHHGTLPVLGTNG